MDKAVDSVTGGEDGAAGPPETLGPGAGPRAEIDTSAPFESVREAVDRFGGSAIWRSRTKPLVGPEKQDCLEEADVMKVEEQAAQLEKALIAKERETLEVLKELEMTKRIVDGLKLKLQKEASEASVPETSEFNSDSAKVHPIPEREQNSPRSFGNHGDMISLSIGAKQSPGLILRELRQAKFNLNRTTSDLAGIRASIDLLNSKIAKEKALLEKTREKLNSNTARVSSLEEDLNKTTMKLHEIKNAGSLSHANPSDISKQIKELSSEMEQYKKMAEAAKSEVSKLTAEVEQSRASIKAAEIRWLAAKKMEEASRASEAVALAEIKALTNNGDSTTDLQNPSGVTLPVEEYVMLTRKAQEAEEISGKKIEAAMVEVDEANRSKHELLSKVEEATAEVKSSRKALEEALNRVEAANRGKLAVEEALRRWRSEHGQKRRCVNSTKFKNSSYPTHHRRDSQMLDVNGLNLLADGSRVAGRPPLSIGQILSMKLMGPEDSDAGTREKVNGRPTVSLGQMLSKRHGFTSPKRTEDGSARKQSSAKRKKFGLVGLSVLLAKQDKKSKKKKRRQAWSPKQVRTDKA